MMRGWGIEGDVYASIVVPELKRSVHSVSALTRSLAPDDRAAVEAAYLTVLTRRPTGDEETHFVERLHGFKGTERTRRMTDLFWTLLNSTEFSWNH